VRRIGACPLVGRAGYATGLVGAARAGEFAGKPWADLVFSIAQFPYHDAVWSGPLTVLVDDETWSAAEEFAAVLQDNRAAVIVGSRTGGAGCGHTQGGTPTVLKHSGATLELPDCVRFRADGSNEVAGVIPDVVLGMRASDGPNFKARLIQAHLPTAIRLAIVDNSIRR
jgi:C-terminal processing protease CtpA/Prc